MYSTRFSCVSRLLRHGCFPCQMKMKLEIYEFALNWLIFRLILVYSVAINNVNLLLLIVCAEVTIETSLNVCVKYAMRVHLVILISKIILRDCSFNNEVSAFFIYGTFDFLIY